MTFVRRILEALLGKIFNSKKTKPETTNPQADTEVQEQLPVNPTIAPDPPVGRGERWDFVRKDYDGTWRIRWPSTLAREHGIGPGSWCTVNGARAEFRSFDTDHGARRPSYRMPMTVLVHFPARCILYTKEGKAIAWFEAPAANTSGRLP